MASNLALAPKQQYSLAPTTFAEAQRFAEIVASSNFAPKGYQGRPGDVLVAVQMGAELGLAPMQALQNIAVINGRPSLWGDAMLAVCMAHPDFLDIIETDDGKTASCTIKRKGRTPVTRTFSMDDAKLAGLIGKQGPWTQYPARMRMFRARGFCCRDTFPDALRGIISQEEAGDMDPIQATATVVQSRPAPADKLSKEAEALQAAIDAPKEELQPDPELDPEDYVLRSGNKAGTPLAKLSPQQLEYVVNRSRDAEARMYARIVLDQRKATAPKPDADDDAQGSWLDSAPAEVTP